MENTNNFYKVSKAVIKSNEAKAKENAAKKLNVSVNQLVDQSTEKQFIYTISAIDSIDVVQEKNINSPFGEYEVLKDGHTYDEAVSKAQDYFQTFEANIKLLADKEDRWIFSKIRG